MAKKHHIIRIMHAFFLWIPQKLPHHNTSYLCRQAGGENILQISDFVAYEIEIGVMSRQCLTRRIPTCAQMTNEVQSWVSERNARHDTVHWHFTTADARIKLQHLYPKF
jgi:hypothetical protein